MRLHRMLENTRENARRHGAPAAALDLACRAINKVAEFRILKAMAVREADVADARFFDAQGLDARFVGSVELERFVAAGEHQLTPGFLEQAGARGDRCYALFDGEALAAYGWYSCLPTPIDENFVLHFDPAYTYMYKGYTAPAYRGRRLHAVGMCRALRALSGEGALGLVSWVDANNFASLQSVARMGYRVFGAAWLLRAGGVALARASAGCRAYGFRVEPAAQAPSAVTRPQSASTTRRPAD